MQSIFYLFGGGNSGKSTVVKVLEGLLQPHLIQHMLRRHSRFTNNQLVGCHLFVLDDVLYLAQLHTPLGLGMAVHNTGSTQKRVRRGICTSMTPLQRSRQHLMALK